MRNNQNSLSFAFGLISIFLFSGCAMTKIPEYNSAANPAARSLASQQGTDLRVAVDPFFEKARSEEYFHVNAFADGIAILHVAVENTSPASTYLLKKEDFKLLLSGSDSSNSPKQGVDRGTAAGEAVALTGAALVSFPMVFAGGKLISDATVVRNNFTSKELHSQTLSPGESAAGFIYFQLNQKQKAGFSGTLSLAFSNSQTQSNQVIQIPVNYER